MVGRLEDGKMGRWEDGKMKIPEGFNVNSRMVGRLERWENENPGGI